MNSDNILGRLITGGSLITLGTILTQVLGFAETVFLTRTFGPSVYGAYALALSTIIVGTLVVQIGLGPTVRRYVSEFRASGDTASVVGVIVIGAVTVVALGGTASIVIRFGSEFLATSIFSNTLLAPIFIGLSVLLVSKPLLDIASEVAMGEQRIGPMLVFGDLGQRCLRLLVVGAAIFTSVGVIEIARLTGLGFVAFAIGAVVFFIVRVYRLYGFSVQFDLYRILSFAIPLIASSIAGRLLSTTDIWMIGYFIGTEAVGVYRPAFALASAIPTIYVGLNKMFSPIATEYIASNREDELKEPLKAFRFWALAATMSIFCWTGLFAKEFIELFYGGPYTEGAVVVIGIGAVLTISVGIGPVGTILESAENSPVIAKSYFVSLLFNAIGNVVAIPVFGLHGAVIATGTSLLLLNILQWFAARTVISAPIQPQRYGYLIVAPIVPLGIRSLLGLEGISLVVLAPIYFVIVMATLIILIEPNEVEAELLAMIPRIRDMDK